MDKRTLPVVILLVIIIVFYWQILEFLGFVEPEQPPTAVDTTEIVQDTAITTPAPQGQPAEPRDIVIEDSVRTGEGLPEEMALDTIRPDTLTIETNEYTIKMTNKGGGPVSILLKEYTYRGGEPIQMMPGNTEPTLDAVFDEGNFHTSRRVYNSDKRPGVYTVDNDTLNVSYTYDSPSGGRIVKRYTFYPDEYHFDMALLVENTRAFGFEFSYDLFWNTPLGVTEPDVESDYDAMKAVAMQGGSRVELDDWDDGRLGQTEVGATTWAGVRNKYFAAVMIPRTEPAEAVIARGRKTLETTAEQQIEGKAVTVGMTMPFGGDETVRDDFRVFVGPLSYPLMSDYDAQLEDMLGIGTFPVVGWLIKPFAIAIMWLLPRMYQVIPNYGIVIILFALLVKLITLPLSLKSFKSMNAMKELQPKIEKLKEKHKKNPQALNQEMMKLYKQHGVNPISGCLPMLPQMPLFFALFAVFRSTILLRDAPFVWFIDDLSRGATSFTDPYIILVLMMVGTQFISQKLTMSSTQQNKMFMYIMPFFMGFIFYRFASGLVLYWTAFSFFSLIDWFLFRRKNPQVKGDAKVKPA